MTQDYYGTKRVTAWPEANGMTGDDGYCVKYEDGYVSWSPRSVFEKAYQPLTALSFGHALEVLKAGGRVARESWAGSRYVLSQTGELGHYYFIILWPTTNSYDAYIPSQADMCANDWTVL